MKRVFFWVQHLLGTGHLRRAATLARALAAEGFDVLLVSGGAPAAIELGGARFHQLEPLRAVDDKLKVLGHLDGRPAEPAFLGARSAALVALLRAERPDIVITEQFPFGRTQMLGELVPLVEAARALKPKPLIVSSVRDVVRDTASPARIAQMLDLFDRHFDLLLIHADPNVVSFGESFAGWPRIKDRAHYTGYVVDESLRDTGGDVGAGEVIVSAGGGAVGGALLRAAIAARPRTSLGDRTWRLLVGANLPAGDQAALQVGPGIIVEPARDDF
ncbi:MAG TPA: glycosyltransferase, partial [Reyranellaceae bacterium]|nr:glycosyltransferase [Reyranellaceae bacterium]